jgi:hypothetical protein
METVLGLAALGIGLALFIGANIVALRLMVGGRPADTTARELRR